MKKIIENEFYNVSEVQRIEEFVNFKAENYRSKELISNNKEAYKVDEVEKREQDVNTNKTKKKVYKDDTKDLLKRNMPTSSISNVVSSIGSTATIVSSAVVGVSIIDNTILNKPTINDTVVGEFDISLLSYKVDYFVENKQVLGNIILTFDKEIEEDMSLLLLDSKGEEIVLKNNYVIPSLPEGDYNYSLNVIKEDKILNTIPINVSTISPISYIENLEYDSLVTYNEDDTFNIYLKPIVDTEIELLNEVYIVDSLNNEIIHEYENDIFQHLGSVVTNNGYSDWATTEIGASIKSMWYRLSRREDDYCIECSEDGISFKQMRICHMVKGDGVINFGIYACSPENSSFKATFTNFEITECKWLAHNGQKPDEY